MPVKQARLIELDFLRGLVLLFIVVDHINGSILSRFTLHAYALNDAAEIFVFLGGFATATAYLSLAARDSESAARNRFFRRAFEIYRAFLVTAALMLLAGFVLRPFYGISPSLNAIDVDGALAAPVRSAVDILLLRNQPYLAAILPMYVLFALAAPFVLKQACARPWRLVGASVMLWALAPQLGRLLSAASGQPWDFNPLAWQLVFVLGAVARCQPVYQSLSAHRHGWMASVAALLAAILACYLLWSMPEVAEGEAKRNLSMLRVLNFLAIAWLAADLVRCGVVGRIARRLPWVVTAGRHGLLCFVAGTVISVVADTALSVLTHGAASVPLGLAADTAAICLLLAVPYLTRSLALKPA